MYVLNGHAKFGDICIGKPKVILTMYKNEKIKKLMTFADEVEILGYSTKKEELFGLVI